jgi:hypothetical protein
MPSRARRPAGLSDQSSKDAFVLAIKTDVGKMFGRRGRTPSLRIRVQMLRRNQKKPMQRRMAARDWTALGMYGKIDFALRRQ